MITERNAIDVRVGANVRLTRLSQNLTEEHLGDVLSLTAEEYLRREQGWARFSAEQLMRLSRLFKVNVAEFFREPRGEADDDPVHASQMQSHAGRLN